jgi:SET domain-containing protein
MRTSPLIEVRNSKIHGKGVFAIKPIRKGTRVIEYLGERITHAEADRRYEDHDPSDNHTFLFVAARNVVIDGAVGGSAARFINHSCDGNCESEIAEKRVFIRAVRNIAPGDELGYDYEIGRDKSDPPNVDEIYACRCGTVKCRGSMLWPPMKKKAKVKAKAKAKAKAKTKAKKKVKTKRSATPKKTRGRR